MTAINERMLLEIEQGKRDVDSFVKDAGKNLYKGSD